VLGLVRDRALLWQHARPEQMAPWLEWQARLHASGVIEAQAGAKHFMSQVSTIRLDDFRLLAEKGNVREYAFDGKAWSTNEAIGLRRRWTHVSGTLDVTFDDFGRVLAARPNVQQRSDL